jgi:hypothetical protein
MSEGPRIYPGTRRLPRELTAEEQTRVRLLEYSEAGFQVFLRGDVDEQYAPYLVADGKVWVVAHGEPRAGRQPDTHALLVEDGGGWGFIVLVSASQEPNAPSTIAELEARAARREEAQARRAQEAQAALEVQRKSARPVTAGDVDGSPRVTLRAAAAQVLAAGGKLEARDGRLVVSLPPSALGWPSGPTQAAKLLYLGEAAVVKAAKRSGEVEAARLPDRELLPSGALAP